MAVEFALTQARKVLSACEDIRLIKPGEKLTSVYDCLAGIGRNCPRSHYRARGFKRQIEHRREIDVESQGSAVLPDDPAMFFEDFSILGCKHFCRRRSRFQSIAEPVHASAFQIHASKQRGVDAGPAFAE